MATFVPGLALLGIGLIGEWLLGPKSATTKPDSMPQLNTAVRGSPMFVTFGSNRVHPQIVWTANFKAVRQKSSGKMGAKGGGSGGFGAAKGGGAAGQSYEYFWDMIFNFGIMDNPAIIRRGWVGADPMDHTVVGNLTGGLNAVVDGLIPFHDNASPNGKFAKLKYTESFFAPGYRTGDANLTTWAYFQTQTGLACQFPNTAWLGFNHLDLGQSPSVPQLSFEFVPFTGKFSVSHIFMADNTPTSASEVSWLTKTGKTNMGVICGLDGNHYTVVYSNKVDILRMEDGNYQHIDAAQFGIDANTHFAETGFDFTSAFTVPAPGTPYFYIVSFQTKIGHYDIAALMYKINANGSITAVGGFHGITSGLNGFTVGDSIYGASVISGNLVIVAKVNTSNACLLTFPLTEAFDTTTYWTPNSFDPLITTLACGNGNFFDYALSGSHRIYGGAATVVDAGGILVYFGQAEYDYVHGRPGDNSVWDTLTGPCVLYITHGGTTDVSSHFGLTGPKTHLDGTASSNYYDDWVNPTYVEIAGEGYRYLIFSRSYTQLSDLNPTGTLARILVYKYTGAGTATLLQDVTTTMFDTQANLGVAPGPYPQWTQFALDPGTGQLYGIWFGGSGSLSEYLVYTDMANLINAADVTPPYIISRILTSDIFGFAASTLFGYTITADRLDQTTYNAAVAKCEADGVFCSVTYTNQDNLLTILNELVSLYQGYLVDVGGKIYFGLVSGVDSPVRTIDNHHLVAERGKPPIQVALAAIEDGYNKVQFNYLDRAIDYKSNQAEAEDPVDIDLNGPRVKTFPARYVMAGSVAQLIATRALWANLYGKDTYDFMLGWKDADLSQGDLITLVDSFDPVLKNGVRARIMKWSEKKRGQFSIQAVREYPTILTSSAQFTNTTSISGGFGTLVSSVAPMLAQRCYELPREFQDSKAHIYFGYNQSAAVMGAQLYMSTDGTNYILTQDVQPFIVSGVFAQDLPLQDQGSINDLVEFFIYPTSGFNAASPTFVQTYALDDVTPAIRGAGGGTFICGSEAIAFETLTLLGQNHYRARRVYRGWGGTPITAHNSGEYFHQHAAGIFVHEISLNDIGTNISYKIAGYNFGGEVYDISSINASSYHIIGDYWLPRVQPRTKIVVDSAVAWDQTPVVGPYVNVVSGGCDIELEWSLSDGAEGFGAGGFGGQGYGHFARTDIFTPAYRVDIASKNGSKVSSFFVNTGYFKYTLVQNSADFGAFGRDLIINVTPYNVKGDGPVANVRSLSLNW